MIKKSHVSAITLMSALTFTVFNTCAHADSGTLVRMESSLGEFDIELFDSETPATTTNFLSCVNSGRYNGTIIHRSIPDFVLQAGGFVLVDQDLQYVQTDPPAINEPGISNLRGTIAMAKLGNDPNSATSQWFINLADNSANLDYQNQGFTVFGKLLGNGMRVAESMESVPVYDATSIDSAFSELPLLSANATTNDLLIFKKISTLPTGTFAYSYDFSESTHGFVAGFADLPNTYDPDQYKLFSAHQALPENLGGDKALFISGTNRSDDLWMYWKKKVTGLIPNCTYEVSMDIELASKYAEGLVGVGGAPGEGVKVKLGAATIEPLTIVDKDGWLRMNIDKGNQAVGGNNLMVVGDVAKPDDGTQNYALLQRDNRSGNLTVKADANGGLWLAFGTDSGFEGRTELYYTKLLTVLAPQGKAQTINFTAIPKKHFKSTPFNLNAKAESGRPVTFTSSNTTVATISGKKVTIRAAGETTITATEPGNSVWQPAVATRKLEVQKASQTVKFNPPASLKFNSGRNVKLAATATSKTQGFTYSASPQGILEIEGSNAKIIGKGRVTITASHPGTSNYLPASASKKVLVK
jgi:cyclophilin family peptidyl-prolyl cis-trans isomerase